jgi:hydrogenase maturation protease
MEKAPSSPVRIIGVGNPFRRDDGVGIAVARILAGRNFSSAEVVEESGEGASLLEAMEGRESVILIDAVSSGAPPGTVHLLNPREETIPSDFFHYSTHAFSVAEAVEMARVLDKLPKNLWIFGIEGEDFTYGLGFTSKVKTAIAQVVRRIADMFKENLTHSLLHGGKTHA